jgi:hypothetical protein
MRTEKKPGPNRMNDEERRKRFQAVVAPATLRWLEKQKPNPGRFLDRLREDLEDEGEQA